MRGGGSRIELSASDLSKHAACRHLTGLDMSVARGLRSAPDYRDPALELLAERGLEHERRYVGTLVKAGLTVVDLSEFSRGTVDAAIAATTAAMRAGVGAIGQAALRDGDWFGRPDVLRRVDHPTSTFGRWSYEVVDTKLAEETRGGTILQLALYSDLLATAQGTPPELFHVVTPDPGEPVQTFRRQDFAAYFRLLRTRVEQSMREEPDAIVATHYPDRIAHCELCRWWQACDRRRRGDDDLSLVAGISTLQRRELKAREINTLAQLATLPVPLSFAPRRGGRPGYERVREQARLQLAGRTQGRPVWEILRPLGPEHGLARLPAPSVGDVFLDLEGDPFARRGGREYLFGLAVLGADGTCNYLSFWAHSDAEEATAFDSVVRTILDAWAANPTMHVYHYAAYEPAAFKRLMGRYASHEADIDRMLRAQLFVDLYDVVRHGVRASVEGYSIKDLEALYSFTRDVDLRDAGKNRRVVERALELGVPDAITVEVRAVVEGYNRDDCISARALRDWLEVLRVEAETLGPLPRPVPSDGAAPEAVGERARRIATLVDALTVDVPLEQSERSDDQQARWLLAKLLEWHSRENKAVWWDLYRLRDLPSEHLIDEPAILTGLEFVERIEQTKRGIPTDRYAFPPQEFDLRDKDVHLRDKDATDFGTVVAFDRGARTVDIRKRGAHADFHPRTIFVHSFVRTDVLEDAIERIADDAVKSGLGGATGYRAACALLLRERPRLVAGPLEPREGESPVAFAERVVSVLDDTILPIQGPPGAGKTFTGARMICELARLGKRIGVTAVSHKVIRHLLDAVVAEAAKQRLAVSCIQKVGEKGALSPGVEEITGNGEVLGRLRAGRAIVAGATAWLWARADARDAVDVLFVDEAGQIALANVLAVSHAAKSVVLLGDPQQLEQPQQGSHPDGTGVSVLEHILQEHQTMPADRGIFLGTTWRLAPSVCAFTSELFYEGRLGAEAGCAQQRLVGVAPFEGSGLWIAPVSHDGNRNSSIEEADAIERIVSSVLRPGGMWIDREGNAKPIAPTDVLVVAPYNAQVALLAERLATRGVRVGTVDKFQGQEAPIVIYSMATSNPEDAPRGMEFLYSLSRLNVATSRSRCACILVANPHLFEPECRTPRQMRLANAMCRYVEQAVLAEL